MFSKLNQREFEDLDDETRVQYEGFRPGMYVRVEVRLEEDILDHTILRYFSPELLPEVKVIVFLVQQYILFSCVVC